MTIKNSTDTLVGREVERLFRESRDEYFMEGMPIARQKEGTHRALLARECFAIYGPLDAQPLPVSNYDIELRKYGWAAGQPAIDKAFHFVVSHYAASLQANDWDIMRHPSFDDYFRGVLALKDLPTTNLPRIGGFDFDALCKRYPPRPLRGLDRHLNWEPPARTRRVA